MKMHGRWVAWMAALALAAMLAATPREGTAGPYKMINEPHPPLLGDPDGPDNGAFLLILQWRACRFPLLIIRPLPAAKDSKVSRPGGTVVRGRRE